MRIGHGYDLHRLEPRAPAGAAAMSMDDGREGPARVLVLAGVAFPDHPAGPISHSDGDAAYHAITDAILGALGEPDIGQIFPDDDARHEGADSSVFLRAAAKRMAERGFRLSNMDVTIICERPKLSPHKPQMIANIARALGCETARINVKGKTHEQVDAVGEGRAVEVHAVALLERSQRHQGETSN
jgi:2-C-methyl-D-erythritol 2,4-cyclodiphosphate synthase